MKTSAHAASKGSDAARGRAQQHAPAARTARSLQPPPYGIGLVDESAPGEATPLSIQRTARPAGARPSGTVVQLQPNPALPAQLIQAIAGAAAAGPRPPIQDPRVGVPRWVQHFAALVRAATARQQQPPPNPTATQQQPPPNPTATQQQPPPNQGGGVPEWAKEDYKKDVKRFLVASVADDKIGSVYFPEGGRIRTTHQEGPARERPLGWTTLRFNIRYDRAKAAWRWKQWWKWKKLSLDDWLVRRLTTGRLPSWAKRVDNYKDAIDREKTTPHKNERLYEVFLDSAGRVTAYHISRGVAEQFKTDKQAVGVLEAAVAEAAKVDPWNYNTEDEEYNARNEVFYKFVEKNYPKLADKIRNPAPAPDDV